MKPYHIGFIHTPNKKEKEHDKKEEIKNLLRLALDAKPYIVCHSAVKRPIDKMVFEAVKELKSENARIDFIAYIGYSDEVRELDKEEHDAWYIMRSEADDEEMVNIDHHIDIAPKEKQPAIQKEQHKRILQAIVNEKDAYIVTSNATGRSTEESLINQLRKNKETMPVIEMTW